MSRAWETLDERETPDGLLELRRRDAKDFLILIGGRVLMNSRASRSEEILGVKTCASLAPGGRVLIGGLGMAMTLRAVLDAIPGDARVTVAELHPIILEWCRGPLAELTAGAVLDPRVETRICDVAECIGEAAEMNRGYDAIVLDLFEGPHARTNPTSDPIYGRKAIARTWQALSPGGVVGVWAEAPERQFEARLKSQGFAVETHRPGRGGLRHWVILGKRPARGGRPKTR